MPHQAIAAPPRVAVVGSGVSGLAAAFSLENAAFRAFTAALGRHPYEEFGINTSRVKDGKVQAIDSSRIAKSLRTVFASGSARDLARLAALAARIKHDDANRFLGSPLFTRLSERYDDEPLSAHFGSDVARHLLRLM